MGIFLSRTYMPGFNGWISLAPVLTELGSHYANRPFYVFFVLRIISGYRVKFV